MDSLKGKNLLDITGHAVPAATALRHKNYIVYYFTASWCTACENLLPQMKLIHEEANKRQIALEIVFVSLDNNEDEMLKYFKGHHGKWFAIPYGDPAADELRLTFGVTSIPHVAVVKHNGTVVSLNGRKEVEDIGINVLVTWID